MRHLRLSGRGLRQSPDPGLARRILARVKPGSIILLHDVAPARGRVDDWLAQVEEVVQGLRRQGYRLEPLSGLGVGAAMAPSRAAAVKGQQEALEEEA